MYTSAGLGKLLHEIFDDQWKKGAKPAPQFLKAVNDLAEKTVRVIGRVLYIVVTKASSLRDRPETFPRLAQAAVRLFGHKSGDLMKNMVREGGRISLGKAEEAGTGVKSNKFVICLDCAVLAQVVDQILAPANTRLHEVAVNYLCGVVEYLIAEILTMGSSMSDNKEWPPHTEAFLHRAIMKDHELRFLFATKWNIVNANATKMTHARKPSPKPSPKPTRKPSPKPTRKPSPSPSPKPKPKPKPTPKKKRALSTPKSSKPSPAKRKPAKKTTSKQPSPAAKKKRVVQKTPRPSPKKKRGQ